MKATVFLGGGRITSALVAGLRLGHYNRPIVVYDRHARKLQNLKRKHGVIAEPDLRRAVESAGLLILAVRPDSLGELLKAVRGILTHTAAQRVESRAFVSLAAGVPLSILQPALGYPVHWARAMPSPVCRIGQGLTALAFARAFPLAKRTEVRSLFQCVGDVIEIPDSQFDAFTVTFSSSHGYHALATLMRAAEAVGLSRESARLAAAHALAGGMDAWRAGNLSLDKLLHEAATPGGTAAAVMESIDAAGYQKLLTHGLRAGIQRARRNAKLVG